MIGNGHHIKLGNQGDGSVWDSSYEQAFQNADNNFPIIISFLEKLDPAGPPFEAPLDSRMLPQSIDDELFDQLLECILSLVARSPKYRESGVALAEEFRGPLPSVERNALIGANISRALPNAMRNLSGSGKFLVIFSPEREFVFGDGFYQNMTIQAEHWHRPSVLVPLLPHISVLYTRPNQYSPRPRLTTLTANSNEVEALNHVVQIYARNCLFYVNEKPVLSDEYKRNVHLIFGDHKNPVERLIHSIPGVPPIDQRLDDFLDLLNSHNLNQN
ncbi:hypothetical protein [Erythrobacter sp. F6033]|uniref:hypothetical protein n=1 Tax=Erythrobacter sp. F6033 TaxID=2926401 RepID=UPI0032B2F1A7